MSEAIRFIWALINQWAALLTGGLIIAFLAAIERRCGRSISWRAFLCGDFVIVLCVFFDVERTGFAAQQTNYGGVEVRQRDAIYATR